jgi:hypothetical protein
MVSSLVSVAFDSRAAAVALLCSVWCLLLARCTVLLLPETAGAAPRQLGMLVALQHKLCSC